MRLLILYLCLFTMISLPAWCLSQNYTVLHISGKIENTNTHQILKPRSEYLKTDKLSFSNPDSRMMVINTSRKVFIVSPYKRDNQLIGRYRPLPFSIDGRPGSIILNSLDLILHLNEETNYLTLGDQYNIPISFSSFPVNQDTFFYVRYNYKGITVNKKLNADRHSLIFSKKDLYNVRFSKEEWYKNILGQQLPANQSAKGDTIVNIPSTEIHTMQLLYYDNKKERHFLFYDPRQADDFQNREFIPFHPRFLDDPKVKEEAIFLMKGLEELHPKDIKMQLDRLHAFMELKYEGKIEKSNMVEWSKRFVYN